jgi:type III pantothenate kinase
VGLANSRRVLHATDIPTVQWSNAAAARRVAAWVGHARLAGVALCSVVPKVTPAVRAFVKHRWNLSCLQLTTATLVGVGIDYPKPDNVGQDRLANALAVKHHYGAPAVVVDFGTAVTFDVVNRAGNYAGGIIAPGLSAMTDYLHEKTALLPAIKIREIQAVIGKNTRDAMLIGAVHGYRGLIRELLRELKQELRKPRLPVMATGGYARLIAAKLPEITAVDPLLTLEGLRLCWEGNVKRKT